MYFQSSERNTGLDVVAVIGMSYCGSTLLNLILDCLPDVCGGGELHWLIEQRKRDVGFKVQCTTCEDKCPFWTRDFMNSIDKTNIYESISNVFHARILVDTSKNISWFQDLRPIWKTRARFLFVVVVKHPIRHLASFLLNIPNSELTFDKKSDYYLNVMETYYDELRGSDSPLPARDVVWIRYEDIVLHTREALYPLLSSLGLPHSNVIHQCYNYEHHQLGGNADALYQIAGKWVFGQNMNPLRKQYYASRKGVFLDNKYETVFSPEQLQRLSNDQRVKRISKLLGYSSL